MGKPKPFANDLEAMQSLMHWVEARCRSLAMAKKTRASGDDDDGIFPFKRKKEKRLTSSEIHERLGSLKGVEDEVLAELEKRMAINRKQGQPLAINKLVEMHGLDDFEKTVVLLAAAPVFSARFNELYDSICGDHFSGGLTPEMVFEFLELDFGARIKRRKHLATKSRLISNDIITLDLHSRFTPEDLLLSTLKISARTFSFLVGDTDLDEEFQEFSSVEEPMASMDQVVLAAEDKGRILSVVEGHDCYLERRKTWGFDEIVRYGRGAVMLFHGPPGTGKTVTAHAVAQQMGKRVLNVDIPTFADNQDAGRFLPGLFRESRLQNAVLFFDEAEALFASRRAGNVLMTLLLTELERFDGIAILATNIPEALDEALDRRCLLKVRFPEPDRQARLVIWQKHIPQEAPMADDVDLQALADRYEFSGGYIKNALLLAVSRASHEESPVITMEHLNLGAQAQLHRVGDGNDSQVVRPKALLKDVVLSLDLNERVVELIGAARSRRMVLERWGIGAHLSYGKGMCALLYGAPGTGKTLCAEAIAGELNRPLITATIPAMVSKWVGATERNLEGIFKKAKAHRAVIFLDECDTLLMERGEGRASRHDDSVVNTILTLIERHDGLILLATNLAKRLDPALNRRLAYKLNFPLPGATERTAIWETLVPATVPTTGAIDFEALGARFELAGGYIKEAVFKAAYRAATSGGVVTQALLENAAREALVACNGKSRVAMGFGNNGGH